MSADGERWVLLNASPEIRAQLESFPALHPRALRHSPIAAVMLTNGDLDHCLGLLSLRESHPLVVYATDATRRGFIDGNVFYRTLERFPDQVTWRTLKPGAEDVIVDHDGESTGLSVQAVPVPGKPPLHLEDRMAPSVEDNVGLRIRDTRSGRVLAYFSGVGRVTADVKGALGDASCVFLDGTFWTSEDLIAVTGGTRRAEDMAHWPVGGPTGSLAALHGLSAARRILIHVNNTNPILREDSPERAAVTAAGWEVAHDGMEVAL